MTGRRIIVTALLVTALLVSALLTGLARLAGADPGGSDWDRLRQCESSGRYDVVSASGRYHGAYQFDLSTWRSVGGTGLPHRATPAEQDFRALYLYRMRGWQPWTCARTLGLREDGDARGGRVPTRAEAAAVGPATAMPRWPGRVYQYGDCDRALRAFQLRMNTFGYDFQGTGCYRGETRAAVLALQRANGITDSGRLGPKTWAAAWQGRAPRR